MVGVGVIGTGFGRTVHIPGFLAVQDATVIGVASSRYEKARQVAEEFSLSRSFATWRELIECPEIGAVSIVTPPFLHEEMVLGALEAGKAVFCEKPLGLNADQAWKMLEAARRARCVHMVNFEFREIPAWQFVKRILEAGKLGKLRHVSIHWIVQSWADPGRPWTWRADRERGGGTLGALGVHVFDYIEWLLGPVRSLSAQLGIRVGQRPDENGIRRPVNAEDCCHLLLELENGAPVNLAISAVAPFGRGHWVEIYGEDRVLVLGSDSLSDYGKGFGVWEGVRGSGKLQKQAVPGEFESEREFQDGRIAPFVKLAQRFIDGVKEERTDVHPSFEEGFRAQKLMDLARQAHTERKWVNVPALHGREIYGG